MNPFFTTSTKLTGAHMNRMDVNNVFTYSGGFMNWIADIVKDG